MSLQSLIACGTKLWLDSVHPDEVKKNRAWGATGATSNPIIISDIIKAGHYDEKIAALAAKGLDDDAIACRPRRETVDGRHAVDVDAQILDVEKRLGHGATIAPWRAIQGTSRSRVAVPRM